MPYYMKSKRVKNDVRQISESDYLLLKDKQPYFNNWEFYETPDPMPLAGVSADEILAGMKDENQQPQPKRKRTTKK